MKIAVIVGAGLATRLRPITEIIPKVLVNFGQDTILKHLHSTYTQLGADKIILIIPSKFVAVTAGYIKYTGLSNIEIKTCDEPLGSAYAIASTLRNNHNNDNIIFNWSDIIPTFKGFSWDSDVVYTFGNECRYNFDKKMINVGSTGGNVIGLYQVKSFSPLKIDTHKVNDFVDVYDFSNFKSSQLENAVDIGDLKKLNDAHKDTPICRSFNSIEFKYDRVIKTALDDQGRDLQAKEIAWYSSQTNQLDSNLVRSPHVISLEKDKIHLELVIGTMLADMDKSTDIPSCSIALLNHSYSEKKQFPLEQVIADYRKEFHTKIYDRNKSIEPMLSVFTDRITSVNGLNIPTNHDILIELAYSEISKNLDTNYEIIHGDLNFSNVIVDETHIYTIDPRGYFGNTQLYGPKDYDIAKIMYAMSGYDLFNKQGDWIGLIIEDDSMSIEINELVSYKHDSRFKRHHHVMVGLIWMALAGYFKNNPYKALASYYYGVYLLTSLYSDKIRFMDKDGIKTGVIARDEPTVRTLITKFPEKWLLVDRETGTEYEINTGSDSIKSQWKKVNETSV